jgi:4a-hydroxytetrahydrobiopterin dehydratase
MTDEITAEQFHASEGVEDWRVLWQWACTRFRTGSFATGKRLVDAISELAEAANHHPDVDLRYGTVDIRITSHDVGGLSRRDVTLARQISEAADELRVEADPAAVMLPQVAIDAMDIPAVKPFWQAVLGYDDWGPEDLGDAAGHGPAIWFQQMDAPRPQRNRIHIDVAVPHDEAEARVAAAIEAGGRLVTDEHAPAWWVLADPEGNEACIATWQGRG